MKIPCVISFLQIVSSLPRINRSLGVFYPAGIVILHMVLPFLTLEFIQDKLGSITDRKDMHLILVNAGRSKRCAGYGNSIDLLPCIKTLRTSRQIDAENNSVEISFM